SLDNSGRRAGPLSTLLVLLGLTGCNPAPDLPPVQASSPHFRYHARNPGDVQADILDRLERNRADFHQFMGLVDDGVPDYSSSPHPDDLARNGPCTLPESDCTSRRSVYAASPLQEHELIHSYMAGVGGPSAPLLEGMAEAVGCLRPTGGDNMPAEPD